MRRRRRRSLYRKWVDEFRVDLVHIAVHTADGDVTRAAWLLDVSPSTIYRIARAGRVARYATDIEG